jgi:nucleoside-diphosphate-sugar epimerase
MGHFLVTGAAGFIGSEVARQLLLAGHSVVGVDELNDAYDVRLKIWRLEQLAGRAGFDFRKRSVCEWSFLIALFQESRRFDGVFHLAARAGVRQSVINPWVYFSSNVEGTLNLLEMCRTAGVGRFVLASTSSLYGSSNPVPYSETANTDRPLSPYAASKKAAEALCYSYHHLHGINVSVLRYFTVFGPAGRPDMSMFRFVQWIAEGRPVTVYGDGAQSRDFTYVEDIARGTIAAMEAPGFSVINLGSDSPIRLMDVIRMIEAELGRRAQLDFRPAHPADVQATWADISRARALLGWESRTSCAEGVHKLIEWYMANREWAKDIETADVPALKREAAGQGR